MDHKLYNFKCSVSIILIFLALVSCTSVQKISEKEIYSSYNRIINDSSNVNKMSEIINLKKNMQNFMFNTNDEGKLSIILIMFNSLLSYANDPLLYNEALGFYEKLCKRHPKLKNQIYTYIFMIYMDTKKYDDGFDFINKLLAKDPSNVAFLDQKAVLYLAKKEYLNAIKMYKQKLLSLNDQIRTLNLIKKNCLFSIINSYDKLKDIEMKEKYSRYFKEMFPDEEWQLSIQEKQSACGQSSVKDYSFKFHSIDGKEIDSSKLEGYVILYFCYNINIGNENDLDIFNKINEKYKKSDILILMVYENEMKEIVRNVSEYNIQLNIVCDKNKEIIKNFTPLDIPAWIILDYKHNDVLYGLSPKGLDEILNNKIIKGTN